MKKFNAIYKRNGKEKAVVIEVQENGVNVVIDEKGSKEVKKDTLRRWYEIGEEIIEHKCKECGEAYEEHDFSHPELCVFCSDIAMMNEMDAEIDSDIEFMNEVLFPEKKAAAAEEKVEKEPKKKSKHHMLLQEWRKNVPAAVEVKFEDRFFSLKDALEECAKHTDDLECEVFLKVYTVKKKSKAARKGKLTDDQVREIRRKFADGAKKSHLAKEYGVSSRTITCYVEYIMGKDIA